MKLKTLLLSAGVALCTLQTNAQTWVADSVSMGAGYANDIYYSFKNGAQPAVANNNWHLAFQMTPPGPYGNVSVLANQVANSVNIYSLHLSATAKFTTLNGNDTIGKTGTNDMLYNTDSSWNYGALNKMNDASNPFDYSWGIYNLTTHNVVGDSLYLITIGAPSFPALVYKLWVKEFVSTPLDSVQWQFRIARFDGSDDTTIRIYRKPAYTDRMFAYYNLSTKTVIDREPSRAAWDVVFTRYKENIVGAPGGVPYGVNGALSNFDVTVAEHHNIMANDTIGYNAYNYSRIMNVIGSDWKSYNMTTNMYDLLDSTYYFVRTKNTNEYYQLQFTGFGGSTNGKIVFNKRFLGTYITGINNVSNPLNAYFVAPNPANNSVNIMIDAREKINNARLMITDITGKTVFSSVVNVNGMQSYKVDISQIASGTYMATLTNGAWKATEKLVIQH